MKEDTIIKTSYDIVKEFNKMITSDSKFACRLCGKIYKRTDAVRKHWRKIHTNVEAKKGDILSYSIPL